MATPSVENLAGQDGVDGCVDGPSSDATMRRPSGLCVDPKGYCFVADTGNAVVRRISNSGMVQTVQAGLGHPDETAALGETCLRQPRGISADDSCLFVAGIHLLVFLACSVIRIVDGAAAPVVLSAQALAEIASRTPHPYAQHHLH